MARMFTVKRLAQAVLPGADKEATDSLMRQIDHWTLTGLYEVGDAASALSAACIISARTRRRPPRCTYRSPRILGPSDTF